MQATRTIATAAALATAFALTSCATTAPNASTPPSQISNAATDIGNGDPLPRAAEVPEIAALVPQKYKDAGKLRAVTTIGMAPLNLPDPATGTVHGFNPELAAQIAAVMGLDIDMQAVTIDQIIPGFQAGRYDITFANMSITDQRKEVLDFVQYYFSASGLGVKAGNPQKLDATNLCGHKIGVSNGSFQMNDTLPKMSDECTKAGKPKISIDAYPDQQKAATAVLSGREDAVVMDGPVLAYAISRDPQLENAAKMTEGSNVGIGVANDDPLLDATAKALQHLMDDGTYEKLLERFGMQDLALDTATIEK